MGREREKERERERGKESERVEAMFSSHGNINEKKTLRKGERKRIQKIAFFAGTHCNKYLKNSVPAKDCKHCISKIDRLKIK